MNDAAMKAEAVAEKGGRIIAVGSAADVMRHRGRRRRSSTSRAARCCRDSSTLTGT